MNEICTNCGKPESSHGDCNFCPHPTPGFDDPLSRFSPSGNVLVPVEFVEAVRQIVENEYRLFYCDSMDQNTGLAEKLRAMLSDIDEKAVKG